MGLRPLCIFNSLSAGIDYRRQTLTSIVDPRTERVKTALDQRLVFAAVFVIVNRKKQNQESINMIKLSIYERQV